MTSLSLMAPAKLNLFLHINAQRADGYHELETLFTFLEFGDELTFSCTEHDKVEIIGDTGDIPLEDNLIYKAALALRPFRRAETGILVSLSKKLPMGGGVGGGSSDAATTLLAINQLWQCHLSLQELAEIGLKLGADVPVFVNGKTALAQGVGEKLTAVKLPQRWFCVVFPSVHVSTGAIFTHPDLPRNTAKLTSDWQLANTSNDCEALVKKLYPEVEKTLVWLLKYGPSRMTGTGACCFVELDSADAAQRVLSSLPSYWQGFVAPSTNISPAHTQLDSWLKMQK
ncbi:MULTISPECIES: 4-(cytidine 5'-diphospho)-2-C-methyl-D-erythritol kinase [Pseudoalteromonas]|uniref:4-diphosphocytidyl-2-C-methyl-D-erythritol kinase n=1 Tax=Pseudoalteromonas amylolytica TaxID=1859457 RepID=A0A1S1MPY5_9GAMM|nr:MULTISPECIES: 4-(cytidine 5'-diphospho)-2-C-methyl-D-erythritol kinase [Pseudoalteromonas]OHU85747.1 4-(cytidine 5'-diphospho)-2-C-methyl-D-erythritol kinase [Pseudoalteromonas sp. JW3]OHU87351.1 4-(cytidine 5'-diphospho)-2-C-methyl-D-erythritol kinase [Pseudoalteromonas amylolytica]